MINPHKRIAKSLLCNILKIFESKMLSKNPDGELIVSNLNAIVRSFDSDMEGCYSKHLNEIRLAYYLLSGTVVEGEVTLEFLIKNEIAERKEVLFDNYLLKIENNYHFLSNYKYAARNILGVEFQINERGRINTQRLNETIKEFLKNTFTPEMMMNRLREVIREYTEEGKKDKKMLYEACAVIRSSLNIEDDEDLKPILILQNPNDIYSFTDINNNGMEIILLHYNLIRIKITKILNILKMLQTMGKY